MPNSVWTLGATQTGVRSSAGLTRCVTWSTPDTPSESPFLHRSGGDKKSRPPATLQYPWLLIAQRDIKEQSLLANSLVKNAPACLSVLLLQMNFPVAGAPTQLRSSYSSVEVLTSWIGPATGSFQGARQGLESTPTAHPPGSSSRRIPSRGHSAELGL